MRAPYQAGDKVTIYGWRHEDSEDKRTVLDCWEDMCESGWMIRLDRPLQNGSKDVCSHWANKNRGAKEQE